MFVRETGFARDIGAVTKIFESNILILALESEEVSEGIDLTLL